MLNFTQEEVEKELADKMPHGLRRKIAARSGLGESYIKRQFNPDDETASCAFRLLQVVCAFDEIDPEQAEHFWQSLSRFRDMSKPAKKIVGKCLNAATGKLNKEIGEFVAAKLEGKPLMEQKKELDDAKRQLAEVDEQLNLEFQRLRAEQPDFTGDISIN